MTVSKTRPNKRIIPSVVIILVILAVGLLLSKNKPSSLNTRQVYDRQAVLIMAKELTDVRGAIDRRLPGLNWTEYKHCKRYPPISIADEESFSCVVLYESEIRVARQDEINQLAYSHEASLGDMTFVSKVNLYKLPIYSSDSRLLKESEFDKPLQTGGLEFVLAKTPKAKCGINYELTWHDGTYIQQVIECNAASTGQFF